MVAFAPQPSSKEMMLELEQIARMREAADTPTDNVQVEEMRGYLGQALDALAKAREKASALGDLVARQQVLELHKGRRR